MQIDCDGIVKWSAWVARWRRSGRGVDFKGYEEFSAWANSPAGFAITDAYCKGIGDLVEFEIAMAQGRQAFNLALKEVADAN